MIEKKMEKLAREREKRLESNLNGILQNISMDLAQYKILGGLTNIRNLRGMVTKFIIKR